MHLNTGHRVQRIQIMPCKVLAFLLSPDCGMRTSNPYRVMQSFSMKVIGTLLTVKQPQITHSCLFLKARLDLTPDVTYVISDYATNLGF